MKKSKVIECEKHASEVAIDVLLEWFSEEAVRLVHSSPDQESDLQQEDTEDIDDDGEGVDVDADHHIQDLTDKLNNIKVENEAKFHIDQLLIEETEVFANKFSAYMRGKEAYEDSTQIIDKEDDDGREPCLPLLDRHAQVQHRIIVVLDQLSRFGTPIYQLLGLPARLVEAELRTIIRSLKLTAENVSLKPLEWRIISIFISYMLSEKSEELSRAIKSKTYVKNIKILLQEFGLDPQILEKTKNNICDRNRFKNK